ncbi:MAG: alpha/beta fold hydrolase [Anderseniella sp.]|jgi:pimeloyl-ACP methyl ester carboxylesterase|nr:alpha/beta fold hydrolase [Anderseniella sp.]
MTMHQNLGDRWPSGMPGMTEPDRRQPAETIIALHCSGADGSQWKKLAAAAGQDIEVITPGLMGSAERPRWTGERKFSLLDEARPIADLIDSLPEPVHLLGHSYGGGVALKVASLRPQRIRSLALYEPSAFSLLHQAGDRHARALDEIEMLASRVGASLCNGSYAEGAGAFVNYWKGEGAWDSLRADVRERLINWLPNASLHFHALIQDGTSLGRYRQMDFPVLLMQGEHARAPSRMIIGLLEGTFPAATAAEIRGAGHMGPVTHADAVNSLTIRHVELASRPVAVIDPLASAA